MKSTKMQKANYEKCIECQIAAEYDFSQHGSTEGFIYCDAYENSISKMKLMIANS
jgi:hypothetical protein